MSLAKLRAACACAQTHPAGPMTLGGPFAARAVAPAWSAQCVSQDVDQKLMDGGGELRMKPLSIETV